MLKQACTLCKIVGAIAIIGALNWGLVGLFQVDLVAKLLGAMPGLAKVVYVLIGVAGLIALVSLVKCCPCRGKSCETKS